MLVTKDEKLSNHTVYTNDVCSETNVLSLYNETNHEWLCRLVDQNSAV